MAKQTIGIGAVANDGTGDPLRTAFDKVNDNFDELYDLVIKSTAVNYTIGTTNPNELYGGIIYVTASCTLTIPAVAVGMSFTVIVIGAVTVSVDPNASDLIYLDGVALADGDKITSPGTAGAVAAFTYYSADGFHASTNAWVDGN